VAGLLIIQIPCFNEEETLPATVADLPREVDGFERVEWLVINDGSSDRTTEVARSLGVDHIVEHPKNLGLAAGFRTGLKTCLQLGADVIVNTDADNQYDGRDIEKLTIPILAGVADVVVGERPVSSNAHFSPSKKWLQRNGSRVVRLFSGTGVQDAASGFRAMSRESASRTRVFGKYSYTMETLVQYGREGLIVESVPIRVNPPTRRSRLVKSNWRYVIRSAAAILRSFALYKPFRLFSLLSSPFLIAGAVLVARWSALFLFSESSGSRIPSLLIGTGLLIFGIQILIVAVIADLIAANRRILSDISAHLQQIKKTP